MLGWVKNRASPQEPITGEQRVKDGDEWLKLEPVDFKYSIFLDKMKINFNIEESEEVHQKCPR